jgi:non-ribosomal peptide synthase protein (TIGR01720 family)
MGYGVLKYLSGVFLTQEEAEITFNYLGNIEAEAGSQHGIFRVSEYTVGRSVAPENLLKDTLSINCILSGGTFNIDISYRKDKFTNKEAECFAEGYIEALQDVINVCVHQKEVIKTSSDFGLDDEKLTQAELDEILGDF